MQAIDFQMARIFRLKTLQQLLFKSTRLLLCFCKSQ